MKDPRIASTGVLTTALLLACVAANASDVFVFGDSLSDAGNIHLLTGQTTKSPYPLVPTYPYTIGGFHYTNGKTWAERFAQRVGDVNGGKASRAHPGKNGNYAHGGGRGRNNALHPSPDSLEQAQSMIADFGGAPADGLYVVQFGGNDIRDAIAAIGANADGSPNLSTSFAILYGAGAEVAGSIQALYAAGARHFLVANAPNVANAPAVTLQGAQAQYITGIFTATFNGVLEGYLQALEVLPGIRIDRLDMYGFTNELVADPGDYGLADVTSPCLNFLVDSGGKCDEPESYMFWDGMHPTAVVHDMLADLAAGIVGAE